MSEAFTQRVAKALRDGILQVALETGDKPMTQDKLAALTGMSQSTLSRRLNGEIPINTDELPRIAAALGLRIDLRFIPVEPDGDLDPRVGVQPTGALSSAAT